jgi:NADH-quinone oxidoreductase subunit L
MALLGVVQYDIKRVVAYSTLSQLGYMTVALGASAYPAAMFHLVTHAFFKALLFLCAGSVIIAMHHEQDMRSMGGLRRYLPWTYGTAVIGALALAGIPPFAGFFSKDAIIEAVQLSHLPGAGFAYFAVLSGVFITAVYTFRMLFMTFHGQPRMDHHTREHLHESPAVVVVPLVLLAIPSIGAGIVAMEPLLFGSYFGTSIVMGAGGPMAELKQEWHGTLAFLEHGLLSLPLLLAVAGIAVAAVIYLLRPGLAEFVRQRLGPLYRLLENKYYLDRLNDWLFAAGARRVGRGLWQVGDVTLIDGLMVNGSARLVGWFSTVTQRLQSGYIYHYAFIMIFGVFLTLTWLAIR